MRPAFSRTGQWILGDKRSKTVHDLHREHEDCAIFDILARQDAVGFIPDRLEKAIEEGFTPCGRCCDGSGQGRPGPEGPTREETGAGDGAGR